MDVVRLLVEFLLVEMSQGTKEEEIDNEEGEPPPYVVIPSFLTEQMRERGE